MIEVDPNQVYQSYVTTIFTIIIIGFIFYALAQIVGYVRFIYQRRNY